MTHDHTHSLHRRRGYMLVEIIVTIALTTLVAAMATQLILRILDTGRSLSDGERDAAAVDRAVATLRHDVERAGPVNTDAAGLAAGAARWAVAGDTLTRTVQGQSPQSFGPLSGPLSLRSADGVVRLQAGEAEWAFAPLADTPAGEGR